MAGRKMLREIMAVNDIYNFAEPITEMLREEYGSYDADSLDEVMVEEPFSQRLAARGYDTRPWAAPSEAPQPAPAPTRAPVPEPVPVTVVRRGRPPGSTNRASGTPTATTRTRQTAAPSDGARSPVKNEAARGGEEQGRATNAAPTRTRRTTRTPRSNGSSES